MPFSGPYRARRFTGGEGPDDVPGSATFPLKFVGKLVAARMAKLLGR
jgi:hypothetical protein